MVGTQYPSSWHWSIGNVQSLVFVPTQRPDLQAAASEHRSVDAQEVPSTPGSFRHRWVSGSQESVVQGFWSSHEAGQSGSCCCTMDASAVS